MTTEINEAVAANLRAEIARRKRRQADLTDVWGISQMGVSRRLAGSVPITAGELQAAAEWLGLDMADLMPGTPEAATA
jgi:transcriptional regulator with XRE-family HTH domain